MSTHIEHLEHSLTITQTVNDRIDTLAELAWEIFRQEINRAEELALEAYELTNKHDYPYGRALTLRTLAVIRSHQGKYDETIQYSHQALHIIDTIGATDLLPATINTLASAYFRLGDLSTALEYQLKQLELAEQLDDKVSYAQALIGMGISYDQLGQLDQTLRCFTEAMNVYEELNNSYGVSMSLNNIAFLNYKEDQLDIALDFAHRSLNVAQEHNHQRMIVTASNTVAGIELKRDLPLNALPHLNHALQISQEIGLQEHQANALRLLGRVHLAQAEHQAAIDYFNQALTIAETINHKQYIYEIHELLAQTYQQIDDFQQALEHYQAYFTLKESLSSEDSLRKRQNMEILHRTETARKEADYYASLYEEEQSRRQLSEVLNHISQTLTSTFDLPHILNQILHQLKALIGFNRGAILLRQENELHFAAARGYEEVDDDWQKPVPIDTANDKDVFIRIYQTKKPLAIFPVAEYDGWYSAPGVTIPGAWLGVPLIRNEAVIGMLSLARSDDNPYTEDEIRLATTLASQTAVAVTNAQLYQQSQQRAEEMATLAQVGRDIAASLDLQTVLERITQHAHEIFQAHTTIIRLRSADQPHIFRPVAAVGVYAEVFKTAITHLGQGIAGDIARTGRAEILNDPESDPRAMHIAGTPKEESDPVTMMCAPISSRDQTIGLMILYRDMADGFFTPNDLNFLDGLSQQAAIAIENAQLYNQIQQFNEQLEEEVAARTEDLRHAYNQLEQLDRTKSDFIGVTAHELRTPITILQGYAQLLEQDSAITKTDYHTNLISGIVNGAKRMHKIVNTMLTMVKVDSHALEIHPEPLPVKRIVDAIADELVDDLHQRQLDFIIDDTLTHLPAIMGDPEALLTVIRHLVINAIKYTPDGGTITAHGRQWHDPPPLPNLPTPAIALTISDTGIGIDTDALDLIFTKFYQTGEVANHSSGHTKFKAGGSGLGLAIARGIAQAHQGALYAESPGYDEEKLPGSHFHLVLPIP
ncbi:MAG TPA: GAF domain-containing protein [Anaerolineae bacterium]|nr:GAF domain-containing protein [Anaerolineae bacterium]